jgi:hypothetical protein
MHIKHCKSSEVGIKIQHLPRFWLHGTHYHMVYRAPRYAVLEADGPEDFEPTLLIVEFDA